MYILVSLPFPTLRLFLWNTADRISVLLSLKHLPGGERRPWNIELACPKSEART